MPECCLGSDLITGFPGESRQDVEQAMKTFLELPFSYLHVFPYSERTGTAATRLDGSVEVVERKRRTARWRALSEQRRAEYYRSFLGNELEVIVENYQDDFLYGTSREFVSVKTSKENIPNWKAGMKLILQAVEYDSIEGILKCQS